MNKSKQKGTRAETAVRKYMEACGLEVTRRPLTGSRDEGDLLVNLDRGFKTTIEVKAGKQTANPSRSQLEEWIRQSVEEGKNSGMPAILIVVRYNRKLKDADCYMPWYGKRAHLYLDELCQHLKEM